MNFIEQLFGISTDGGSGSTELIYFVLLGLVVLAYAGRRTVRTFLERAPVR